MISMIHPLRVAQVAPLYESVPPKLYGGTERIVSFLTEALVAAGHDVTLFASGDSVTGARLVPATEKALRLSGAVDQLAPHITMLQLVQNNIKNFDVVHYHIDYMHYPVSCCAVTPHITTLHGKLSVPELEPLYKLYKEIPVVSISNAQRAPLSWINWQGTVYHGLPEDLFTPHYQKGEYLAFLGRISPEKGVDQAIAIAIECGIPLKIAAKIDSHDKDYYETHIRKQFDHPLVEYVGEITEAEKNEFLGKAMALLFPINWPEPFGLVMIESLACGTPVIAYRNGSVPEILADGSSGFIVTTREEAVAAVHTIESIDRRECRRHFEERFTAARMADDYIRIYRHIMKSKNGELTLKPAHHEFH